MAFDYIEIGPGPHDEDCVQVSRDTNYLPAMRAECNRFIEVLRAKYGPEPEGARLMVKSNSHEFGTYLEVACKFDDNYPGAIEYAFACEDGVARWPS